MDNQEYVEFLRTVLIKIENTINLMDQKPSKHIPSYHKMLGVQQKLAGLDQSYKNKMFPQLINVRSIIHYFMNGRYAESYAHINKLKGDIIKICLDINENEKNKV